MKIKLAILLRATLWAMLIALALNIALLFIIGLIAGYGSHAWSGESGSTAFYPVTPDVVIYSTLASCMAAMLFYLPLWSFIGIHSVRIFRLTSLIVLLISFLGPAGLPQAPVHLIILLDLMHTVTAAAVNWAYTVWAHNRYHAF